VTSEAAWLSQTTCSPHIFASEYIFEAVLFTFRSDVSTYVTWKSELAVRLGIDPRAIAIVGSATLGFSLNPDKGFKRFGSHQVMRFQTADNCRSNPRQLFSPI
jgi:hypothetical protein